MTLSKSLAKTLKTLKENKLCLNELYFFLKLEPVRYFAWKYAVRILNLGWARSVEKVLLRLGLPPVIL